MYKSPIDIFYGQIETQIEGEIMKAVQKVHVNVDKDELLRALQYDRGQYEKGYDDAIAELEAKSKWIPVTERLPQEGEHKWITCEVVQVLLNDGAVTVGYCNRGQKLWYHLPLAHTFFVGSSYEKTPVVAWQPLAEPPKGE